MRLAAAWAAQLELVEVRGHSVRFPHSLMQAYLGSRMLDAALRDPDYLRDALQYPKRAGSSSSRSYSCRQRRIAPDVQRTGPAAAGRWPIRQSPSRRRACDASAAPALRKISAGQPATLASRRCARSRRPETTTRSWICTRRRWRSTGVSAEPAHEDIAAEIRERWTRIHAQDPRTLEEGKLALVHRFGEAARMVDDRWRRGELIQARRAVRGLLALGCSDRSYVGFSRRHWRSAQAARRLTRNSGTS